MTGEISYDLVMEDEMEFIEGSYRLPNSSWQVFVVSKAAVARTEMTPSQWSSGVTGVIIQLPLAAPLNKRVIEQVMAERLGVNGWHEVRGPDSMQLR